MKQAPWWLVLVIYNLLSPILFLAMLPGWLTRARARGRWNEHFSERLGFPAKELRDWCALHSPVWIHAVSVGECGVALRVTRQWLELDQNVHLLLTTTTATGRGVLCHAMKSWEPSLRDRIRICWAPFDLLPCAWFGVRSINPSRLVLTEGEWWPNWLACCGARGVSVSMYNARMSPRSARRVAKFNYLVGPIFRRLEWIGLQRSEDGDGFAAIGVKRDRLEVTGSVKYDRRGAPELDQQQLSGFRELLGRLPGDEEMPVLMGVSTFAGEEELLAQVAARLSEQGSPCRLVLVPRHAERGDAIRAKLETMGWRVWQRSRAATWPVEPLAHDQEQELLLVDSTGELRAWLELADVAVIGKSLLELGGQNPVEPIEAGAAVICGPRMDNFKALVAELVAAGAFEQVPEPLEGELRGKSLERGLVAMAGKLLGNPSTRKIAVAAGRSCLARHEGATRRTVSSLQNH